MNCPNCHEETKDPLDCEQCASTFCSKCNPHFDHAGEVCQACQERNSIEAFREHSWTAKLRRWFNKPAPIPDKPGLIHPLPWAVARSADKWHMYSVEETTIVAVFDDLATAEYACNAANAYYHLSMIGAITYNRIREGNPFFNGGKEDCELWMKVKSLLK
jgi:hypothetical protein